MNTIQIGSCWLLFQNQYFFRLYMEILCILIEYWLLCFQKNEKNSLFYFAIKLLIHCYAHVTLIHCKLKQNGNRCKSIEMFFVCLSLYSAKLYTENFIIQAFFRRCDLAISV